MNSKKMAPASFTGYLVGKVQLDGVVQSEVLTSLVATLFQRYNNNSNNNNSITTDPGKRCLKFEDNIKYLVECSERGLKLTSPGVKPKDEGFESDCDSIRSMSILNSTTNTSTSSINNMNEIELSDLMNHLNVSTSNNNSTSSSSKQNTLRKKEKVEKTNSGGDNVHNNSNSNNNNNLVSLSSTTSSSGNNSIDNTSISSSQNIQISDDNNSSSGNGSDSDEFCASGTTTATNSADEINHHHHRTSPYWEILPNLSSFQSYPIEDVVFCHCDIIHPNVLVWVVRHLSKMIALVTAFRTKVETEQLFQKYRELRVLVKPIKFNNNHNHNNNNHSSYNNSTMKMTPIIGSKVTNAPPLPPSIPITLCPAQQPPIPAESELVPYSSLPSHVLPTEILYESKSQSPLFFSSRESSSSKHQELNFEHGGGGGGIGLHSANLVVNNVKNNHNNNHYLLKHHSNSNNNNVKNNTINSSYSKMNKLTSIPWSSSSLKPTSKSLSSSSPVIFPNQHQQLQHHFLHSNNNHNHSNINSTNSNNNIIKRFDGSSSLSRVENNANEYEEDFDSDEVESQQESFFKTPLKPFRKTGDTTFSTSSSTSTLVQQLQCKPPSSSSSSTITTTTTTKPVVLVPLKTETVSSPRHIYPKESYLYHVMGRTSSTFAPYQRSINFLPQYAAFNGNVNNNNVNGTEYFAWGKDKQAQVLVPFSSWMEIAENVNKTPHQSSSSRKIYASASKGRLRNMSSSSRTSALSQLSSNSKGTAKILLRDSSGHHHGMWATLSQRFKRNIRESLIHKFNGVWTANGAGEAGGIGRGKKKAHKKVTFNAWATVQMV